MMGGANAHYDGIKAFKTDQTADLRAITVPTLIQQGDDQVAPYKNAALKQTELIWAAS